ncbi:MAG: class I SAM-dependent methyltransferase [Proteobacteria bacterium]|nr:class I SAM-dependent methyltransferase [Pseudomonadota bacterium]
MTAPPPDSKYVPALGYHWLTPYYDVVVGATTRERTFKKALIQQARFEAGQQILDLACGTGTLAIMIKCNKPAASVTAVDGDQAILSLAERKANRAKVAIQFDHAFSEKLPYPDEHFDRVVSSLFFHHLTWDNKKRTACEIYRVLKPRGELHVADWGRAGNKLMRGLFFFIQVLDGFETTQDNVSGKLIELFEQEGFAKVAERQSFPTIFGTMALYSAVKNS